MAIIEVPAGQSIQNAINSAVVGDTVLLGVGTHVGGVNLNKAITLKGQAGAILQPSTAGTETGVNITASNAVVRDMYLQNFSMAIAAFSAPVNGIQVLNNHTYRSQFSCWINGNNWLIEGNDFERAYWWSGTGDADYCRMFGTGHTFRRNACYGTIIPTDLTPLSGNDYAHCDCIQWYGLNGEVFRSIIIEENFFIDYVQGLFIADEDSVTDIDGVTIRHNVFWGTVYTPPPGSNLLGLPSWGILIGKNVGARNILIENNILYRSANFYGLRADTVATLDDNIAVGDTRGTVYDISGNQASNITELGGYVYNYNWIGTIDPVANIKQDPVISNTSNPYGNDGQYFTSDDGWISNATALGYGPQLNFGADTVPPVITRVGPAVVSNTVGEPYLDLGATAIDNVDGTVPVTVTSNVNSNVVGTYQVRYDAVDAASNQAVPVFRTVNIVDAVIPVITILGASYIEHPLGTAYADPGATMVDNYDGNITNLMVTTIFNSLNQQIGAVNINLAGTYTIRYNGADSSGNVAEERIRTVVVQIPPTTLPPTPTRPAVVGNFHYWVSYFRRLLTLRRR